jgi:hypothetical protein
MNIAEQNNPFNVPQFVRAGSPQGLVQAMRRVNVSQKAVHNFFAIQKDGGNWVAWYYPLNKSTDEFINKEIKK